MDFLSKIFLIGIFAFSVITYQNTIWIEKSVDKAYNQNEEAFTELKASIETFPHSCVVISSTKKGI